MRFVVSCSDGRHLSVEAADWTRALRQAIDDMGIEVAGWLCDARVDGSVLVHDPLSGWSWRVAAAEGPTVLASAPSDAQRSQDERRPWDLDRHLLEVEDDIAAAPDANAACRATLDGLKRLLPAAQGRVLRTDGHEADEVTFVTTQEARPLVSRRPSLDRGVLGACLDLGITIQVEDRSRGFTRTTLCVPVRSPSSRLGAIEVTHPTVRSRPWHVEVVESVARALAGSLAGER